MCDSQPRRRVILFWIISLILLLLVVGWFLLATAFKSRGAHLNHRTMVDLKDIQVDIGHYRTEYNAFPAEPTLGNADTVPIKLRGPVLEHLLGSNPRQIKFVDIGVAKPGGSGLAMEDGMPAWHDRWGTCYFIMLDLKAQNRMPNPAFMAGAITPRRTLSTAPKLIPASTLVFSAGPDRDPNTWADNITSWR
jgi:hypothetical protein